MVKPGRCAGCGARLIETVQDERILSYLGEGTITMRRVYSQTCWVCAHLKASAIRELELEMEHI